MSSFDTQQPVAADVAELRSRTTSIGSKLVTPTSMPPVVGCLRACCWTSPLTC